VAESSGALLLIERDGQLEHVGENVAAEAVQRGLAGTDESLDAEEGDDGLHGEHADEHEDDVIGTSDDLRRIDALAEGVGRISDELLEIPREGERQDGGEEERGQRWEEN